VRKSSTHKVGATKVVFGYRKDRKGMADYYALIRDAIAALDNKTGESRRAFYDRARATLADELRKAAPPLPEPLIEHERLALEDAIIRVEGETILNEASSAQPNAKMQRERRFVFLGFLILSAVWIGDLFYKPPTFSDWYDWLRLGGVIFFPALTILSYFIMRKNWSVEQEERAYIVWAPIILVGTVLVSVALYYTIGNLAGARRTFKGLGNK